jgi:hypothetical protein
MKTIYHMTFWFEQKHINDYLLLFKIINLNVFESERMKNVLWKNDNTIIINKK